MSQQNLVSVSITPEELKQISGAIDTLKTTLLTKLKVLNPTERQELPKMGDKSLAFVRQCNRSFAKLKLKGSPPDCITSLGKQLNREENP